MEKQYLVEVESTKPLQKMHVKFKLIDFIFDSGDDFYRLICDDGICEKTVYLNKEATSIKELLDFKESDSDLEGIGYVSLVSSEEKSLFLYSISSLQLKDIVQYELTATNQK